MLRSLGQRLSWIGGLGSSQADKFGAAERKGGIDENGAETFEAVTEGDVVICRVVPVPESNVAAVVGGDATAVDNDTEYNEAQHGDHLDHPQNELYFTVALDTEELDDYQSGQEDSNPNANVVVMPITDCQTCRRDFEGKGNEPADCVLPTHREACEPMKRAD